MATQLFPLMDSFATTHLGNNTVKLDGNNSGWKPDKLSTSRGSGLLQNNHETVAGPTNGVEFSDAGGTPREFLSEPVDQDVTISGTITANIWAAESNMNANVSINFYVDKVAATDGTLTRIVTSTRTTEVAVTTRSVNNFTATPGAGVTLNKGDRLRFVIFGDDSNANMGSGFTFNVGMNGPTVGADGDTWVQFTETFGFQTTDPTGSTVYLTNDATTVATSDTDYEAWTARGNAAVTSDSTTVASTWSAPIQIQAASANVSWFTKPLQAVTLGGLVKCNLRARQSGTTGNASVGVEIARVDGDGTNPTVWGYANRDAATTNGGAGEISTSEAAYTIYVSGDDLSISDGQRLRIRAFIDDCADVSMATGVVGVLVYFDGPTGGASGDTFLTFGQTLAEFSAGPATSLALPRVTNGLRLRDPDPWGTGWMTR